MGLVTNNDILVGIDGQFDHQSSNIHIYGHLGDKTKNFYALSFDVKD